jgi:homocysteine S-methyltransferase
MAEGTFRRMLAKHQRPIIMDGGMGSTIEDRGIDVGTVIWGSYCFVDGQGLQINDQIHADFVAAGAEILIANTHNTRRAKCIDFLSSIDESELPQPIAGAPEPDRPEMLQRWLHAQAVDSAKRAIPSGAEIAVASCLGSVEPVGAYAKESQLTSDQAYQRLVTELEVRKNTGVNLIIFETLTTRSEIEGVARLARENDIGDFAVGLTCRPGGQTVAKVSLAEVADILGDANPLVYFVQCTRYDCVKEALEQLQASLKQTDLTGVYANDGRIWQNRRWEGERTSPQAYAKEAVTWKQMGARIIGGCCGIGPDHIAELRSTLV